MEGYISEDRWIDLSVLPRSGCNINWTKSVGFKVPFQYKNIKGYINIVGRSNSNNAVMITIDKYIPNPRKLCVGNIKNCELQKLVYNRIADMRPDLIRYLDNPDDAYLYSVGSSYSVGVHCPICEYKTHMDVCTLSAQGLSCPICGKGFSYPSKLMANILETLDVPFIREASKNRNLEFWWAQDYRYDFYIHQNNRRIIIEMDGWFHQYNKDIDIIKDKLAIENGFEVIRIDCNYPYMTKRLEYIKKNILDSELSLILPLHNVEWDKCNKLSLRESPVQKASLLWENEYKSVKEISEIFQVDRETILKYLKIGKEIGLCPSYNAQESEIRSHSKCVAVYDNDGKIMHVFRSATEASALSKDVLGVSISVPMIGFVCTGRCKTAKGFKMSYISYDNYKYYQTKEQYKMIENNNLQEVV